MKQIELIVTIRSRDDDDKTWEQCGKAVFTPKAPMDEIVPNSDDAYEMAGTMAARLWKMFLDSDCTSYEKGN